MSTNETIIADLLDAAAQCGAVGYVQQIAAGGVEFRVTSGNSYFDGINTIFLSSDLTGLNLIGTLYHEADHVYQDVIMRDSFETAWERNDLAYATDLFLASEASAVTAEGLSGCSGQRLGYLVSRYDFQNIYTQAISTFKAMGIADPSKHAAFFDHVKALVANKIKSNEFSMNIISRQAADYLAQGRNTGGAGGDTGSSGGDVGGGDSGGSSGGGSSGGSSGSVEVGDPVEVDPPTDPDPEPLPGPEAGFSVTQPDGAFQPATEEASNRLAVDAAIGTSRFQPSTPGEPSEALSAPLRTITSTGNIAASLIASMATFDLAGAENQVSWDAPEHRSLYSDAAMLVANR